MSIYFCKIMSKDSDKNSYGVDFITRIDDLLKEINLTRKDFAIQLNIPQTTMSSWKTNNSVPPLETVELIADKLNVSPTWLLFGDKYVAAADKSRSYFGRIQVMHRIHCLLLDKTNHQDGEIKNEELFDSVIGHIISYAKLSSWSKGRYNIDLCTFQQIASELNTSIQYLLTDISAKIPGDFDPVLFNEAKENQNAVHCLYNLSEDKKKIVGDMLNKLMELEHLEQVSKK